MPQDLAQAIIDLVFEDEEMQKLQKKAMVEVVTFGEVSEITRKYVEQRINEIVESWKQ